MRRWERQEIPTSDSHAGVLSFVILLVILLGAMGRCADVGRAPVLVEGGEPAPEARSFRPPPETRRVAETVYGEAPPARAFWRSDRWRVARTIRGTSRWYGVDPLLVARVIRVESTGDTAAVSRKGAVGLGQIMPGVWGGRFPVCGEDLMRIRTNICYTVRILGLEISRRASLREALLFYNGCRRGWACDDYPDLVLVDD